MPHRAMALIALACAALVFAPCAEAAPMIPGNLVVLRIGVGAGALSSAAQAVFLDEYTTSGSLVQSIALPTTTIGMQHRIALGGTSTTEGFLNMSADGRFILVAGYDAAPGATNPSGTTSANVPRVIARIDMSGNIDTSTALADASTSAAVRSADSFDGSGFWIAGGAGGVRYAALGATLSTQLSASPANARTLRIFANQLYVTSAASGFIGVNTVGAGLQTASGQSVSQLPSFAGTSPYDFFFADASTVYLADDTTGSGGGLQKWVYNGSAWSKTATFDPSLAPASATNKALSGVSGYINSLGQPVMFATGAGAGTTQNKIYTITDSGGSSTFSIVAAPATNTNIRGIRYIPLTNDPTSGCTPPSFSLQPASSAVFCIGSTTTTDLSVAASGTGLSYQWQQSTDSGATWINVTTGSGPQTSFYTTPATLTTTTQYRCLAITPCGVLASDAATVTINATNPPIVTASPAAITSGGSATLTAAFGASEIVDWFTGSCGGTPVPGGMGVASISVSPTITTTYYARARNTSTGCPNSPCTSVLVIVNTFAPVVISQVYAQTLSTSSTYKANYIELFNRTASDVPLSSYSLQTINGTGATWRSNTLTGSIPANGYYLIRFGAAGAGLNNLPATQFASANTFTTGFGKAALVSNTLVLTSACPLVGTGGVLDLVGWGAPIDCFEGSGAAAAPTSITAIFRSGSGCTDTDSTSADFSPGTPSPHNSSSTINSCTPTGACCLPGGACAVLTASDCTAASGSYASDNTVCASPAYSISGHSAAIEDISASGTPFAITNGTSIDDANQMNVPIGFTFNYFGTPRTTINICSNGFLFFGSVSLTTSNQVIPSTNVPNEVIAPYWMDLVPPSAASIRFATLGLAPNRRFIVQWTGCQMYNSGIILGSSVTAQAILYEGSDAIEFRYGGINAAGQNPSARTIGLENVFGTAAYQVSYATIGTGGTSAGLLFTPSRGGCIPAASQGACCAAGSCQQATSVACAAIPGIFKGDGTLCSAYPAPSTPTGLAVDHSAYCVMAAPMHIVLTASAASGTIAWYSGAAPCGSTFLGYGSPRQIEAPTTSTTYFARAESDCGNSTCASIDVTVITATGACCTGSGVTKICTVLPAASCAGPVSPTQAYRGDCSTCTPTSCCAADFDNNTLIQVGDIFAFLSAWFAQSPAADFDASGPPPQVGDIFAFLSRWFGGC